MCGFAGIFQPKLNQKPSQTLLESMAEAIVHRGPDELGVYADGPLGLGHRRLSIIDLTSGQQPMHSSDGDITLAFNGEIFNYIELRQELKNQGVQFQTSSDTEVLLKLYQHKGLDCLNLLNGQFAIAIWHKSKQQLILARDRVGICPLYFWQKDGQWIFGSEIKALKPAIPAPMALDVQALDQIFTFWAPAAPNTIFENVKEVKPGHVLIINQDGQAQSHQYWDWQFPTGPEGYRTESENILADELHDLLKDATQIRLRSDVPVGAYLSGGLDSSVLVAMIHHYGGVPLKTFSINFSEKSLDEGSHQKELIDHLQADHCSIYCRPEDIAANLVQTVWHTENPILRTAPAPMGMLSGLVHQQDFKVVLTGEGSDEVLGGYDIFKEAKVRHFWARNSDSQWRASLLKRLYPYLNIPDGKAATYLKAFFGEGLDHPEIPWFSHLPRWSTTAKAKQFFSAETKDHLAHSNTMVAMADTLPSSLADWHTFNRAQYIESKSLMAGYLLTSQGDRMLARHSVEGRFPFLDHRVIEFANQLPPKLKMRAMNEKYLLKKAMAKYLPESIVARHKQPYRAPDVLTLVNHKMKFVDELLSESWLTKTGYFDAKKTGMLWKKANSGRNITNSESQALIGILTTQITHALFVENISKEELIQ